MRITVASNLRDDMSFALYFAAEEKIIIKRCLILYPTQQPTDGLYCEPV